MCDSRLALFLLSLIFKLCLTMYLIYFLKKYYIFITKKIKLCLIMLYNLIDILNKMNNQN
jgi:hypothetical protein